jgi:hypothetical protein
MKHTLKPGLAAQTQSPSYIAALSTWLLPTRLCIKLASLKLYISFKVVLLDVHRVNIHYGSLLVQLGEIISRGLDETNPATTSSKGACELRNRKSIGN